jgi:hypothetical protein
MTCTGMPDSSSQMGVSRARKKRSMSESGQSRRFDLAPTTSGVPQQTDILSVRRHVSNVPKGEVNAPPREHRRCREQINNTMTFPGIKEPQQRSDLLTFLKQATEPGSKSAAQQVPQMGGMMGGGTVPNLKTLDPEDRVQSVGYCGDTYEVAMADGKKRKFWERNLRIKTDSSHEGPTKGAAALVPAGMMGDRADVIFSGPDEISEFVHKSC